MAGLPGAVHLVAEAPEPDAEGVLVAVGGAEVGQGGALGVVGVLLEFQGFGDAAGAEVDGHHGFGLGADLAEEGDVLREAEAVGLRRVPGEVEAAGAGLCRADRVFPLVARDEVAAGVADGGDAEFPHEVQDVLAEAGFVGCGVVGFEDAGVDAAAEVFYEAAEEARVDLADCERGVEGEAGGVHACLSRFSFVCGCVGLVAQFPAPLKEGRYCPAKPVCATPATIWRWKNTKTMIRGRPAIRPPAMSWAHWMP